MSIHLYLIFIQTIHLSIQDYKKKDNMDQLPTNIDVTLQEIQADKTGSFLAGIGAMAFKIASDRQRMVFKKSKYQHYQSIVNSMAKKSFSTDNWDYKTIKNELLKHTSTKSKNDDFVLSHQKYPHFHIGSNFICLSTGSTSHNYLINPQNTRTPEQFFQSLRQCNNENINKILELLRQMTRGKVEREQISSDSH